MRLPADRREWVEAICGVGAFALLAFLVFRAVLPQGDSLSPDTIIAHIADLPALTRNASGSIIHFELEGTPGVTERAWENALRSARNSITWSGDLHPVVVSGKPNANPERGHTVSGYAPRDSLIMVRDNISTIDSASNHARFISIPIAVSSGLVRAVTEHDSASVELLDSALLRSALVIGRAGWETKFVIAALEEAGWRTDALIFVAPSVITTQGPVTSIDTAHYSAVVALDESAGLHARDIDAFVRSGGGLVLGEAAARSPGFAQLRVSASAPTPRSTSIDGDTVSHGSAPFTRLDIRPSAVAIEQRAGDITVAAIRVDFGRVIQVGFADTWRWRMQGSQQSIIDHRDWWSGLVSNVAYAPTISNAATDNDGAPYAEFVSIAGPPATNEPSAKNVSESTSDLIWILFLFGLLMSEWTSRRLRGAR